MGRKACNTERGSRVAREKRKREALYAAALMDKQAAPGCSLAAVAHRHSLCARELQRRWRRHQRAVADGDPSPSTAAARDRRGGHNRAFTAAQEALLSDMVLSSTPAMTHSEIQRAAIQLKRDVHVAAHGGVRELRRDAMFKASPRFIAQFKRRNRLSSHRTTIRWVSKSMPDPVEQEHNILNFVNDVRTAIDTHGTRNVLNMDETPVSKCDHPITGVVRTGSGRAAECRSNAGNRLNITHFPCISAAGDKLQLCAIIKGKTARSLKKIQEGASAAANRVRLYFSPTGWINAGIMLLWLEDVIKPFLHGEPGALLLDDYHAHWTAEVRDKAAAMHLQLIKVPPGLTSYYQPLDVSFNGPMVKARQRIWLHQRLVNPAASDTHQNAVERAQLAYEGLSRASTIDAWRKAFLVD